MKFTEEKLEKAFAELLGQEIFPHYTGITLSRYFLFNRKPNSHSDILFVNKFKMVNKSLIFSMFLFNSNSEISFNLVKNAC